jgi:hypothetical protein
MPAEMNNTDEVIFMTLNQKRNKSYKRPSLGRRSYVSKNTQRPPIRGVRWQSKNLFTQISGAEKQHLSTLDTDILGHGAADVRRRRTAMPSSWQSACSPADKQSDAYLCADLLATEKHVSSE